MELEVFGNLSVPPTADLSQVVMAGSLIFLSGQIGMGHDGNLVGSDAEAQMVQAFINVDKLLRKVGSTMNGVIKITSYLTRETDRDSLLRVRRQFFSAPYPASTLLVVKQLASPDYLYEVDVVAATDATRTMSRSS